MMERTISRSLEHQVDMLKQQLDLGVQLLKDAESRAELAESEWRVYAQMTENMSKRIAGLVVENGTLRRLLQSLLDDSQDVDRVAATEAYEFLHGKD
jgi:uncharacterized membrane-anchored protein YhcB (DUF1043 family)